MAGAPDGYLDGHLVTDRPDVHPSTARGDVLGGLPSPLRLATRHQPGRFPGRVQTPQLGARRRDCPDGQREDDYQGTQHERRLHGHRAPIVATDPKPPAGAEPTASREQRTARQLLTGPATPAARRPPVGPETPTARR